LRYFFSIVWLILVPVCLQAQKAAARYEIDAKRLGVSPVDKDALPRGREFIRLDSTYYVGWMYQGIYLHDRSVDLGGYQKALPLLRKAFLLMEKDFGGLLSTIYNEPMLYMQNNLRYNDYLVMARALREGYEYTDRPDSAMWVLDRVERKNFRRDFLGINGTRAWIIHRNRFYTSKDFSFLGNSVAENTQRALQACYKGFGFINRNMNQNNLWFGEFQSQFDRQFIYHYLALIHCYLKNYDSSNYYYQQMAEAGTVSWNNYGSMKAEIGEFAEAMDMYGRDKYKYGGVKNLMEPYYYLPILNIYAGKLGTAIDIASEAIAYSNSSPGFGWYNIALARCYLYDGQLDSAYHTLEKAANFKEIHIGTTLTLSMILLLVF
jgi:tetratricopeptide (TPR) repeat protein